MLSRADSTFHRRQPAHAKAHILIKQRRVSGRLEPVQEPPKHFLLDLQARQEADHVSALPSCRGRFVSVRCNMICVFSAILRLQQSLISVSLSCLSCLSRTAVAWGLRRRQCFGLDFALFTAICHPDLRP